MKPASKKFTPKKIAILGVMAALSIILSFFDGMLSYAVPVALPGFKIGLANIVTLFLVLYMGPIEAVLVVFIRCLVTGIYYGGVTAFFISLLGGVLAVLAMGAAARFLGAHVSYIGISVLGAAFHNIGQVIAVILILKSPNYIFYLPILLAISVITGFVIGLIGIRTFDKIKLNAENG